MRRYRLTIAGSMTLVALMAIGLASLRRPTPLAASVAFSLAIMILLAAVVAAMSLTGRARGAWGSFAACGAVYLVLILAPGSTTANGPHLISIPLIDYGYYKATGHGRGIDPDLFIGRYILKDILNYWVATQAPPPSQWDLANPPYYMSDFYVSILMIPWAFSRIAHSMLCLVVASAGGIFSLWLTGRQGIGLEMRADDPDRSNPSPAERP